MKKKIYVFILAIILLAGLGVVFYMRSQMQNQPESVAQDNQKTQQTDFSIVEEKDFTDLINAETYKLGAVEFKAYAFNQTSNVPGYFEIYSGGVKVFTSQPNYRVGGLTVFNFRENKYVVVKDYSGGAHCCDTDYLFRINNADQVKLIKTFDMGNATISKDNLLFKNNTLYFVLTDDRFQYFHVSFANSYFFQQYLKLEGDAVTPANSDFADDITKTAEACKAKIAKDPAHMDSEGNYWLNDAVCYIANYTLIGKQNVALKEFNSYFNTFFPNGSGTDEFGETITREALKQEITDMFKNDRFK